MISLESCPAYVIVSGSTTGGPGPCRGAAEEAQGEASWVVILALTCLGQTMADLALMFCCNTILVSPMLSDLPSVSGCRIILSLLPDFHSCSTEEIIIHPSR